MTVFVSPPNRLPALLPSTAHPAGLMCRDTLFSSLGSSQDVRSTHLPFGQTSHQSIDLFTTREKNMLFGRPSTSSSAPWPFTDAPRRRGKRHSASKIVPTRVLLHSFVSLFSRAFLAVFRSGFLEEIVESRRRPMCV